MVPLNDGINIISRGQNQVGFIWKYILNDPNLTELGGIYEWRAIRQDQPNRVIYVGSTCTRCSNLNDCGADSLGIAGTVKLGPVVRRPISANPGLNFKPSVSFSFVQKHFSE